MSPKQHVRKSTCLLVDIVFDPLRSSLSVVHPSLGQAVEHLVFVWCLFVLNSWLDVICITRDVSLAFPVQSADNEGSCVSASDDLSSFPLWSQFRIGPRRLVDLEPNLLLRREVVVSRLAVFFLVPRVPPDLLIVLVVLVHSLPDLFLVTAPLVHVIHIIRSLDVLVVLLQEDVHCGPQGGPWIISQQGAEWRRLDCPVGSRVVAEHQGSQKQFPFQRGLVGLRQRGAEVVTHGLVECFCLSICPGPVWRCSGVVDVQLLPDLCLE